MKLNKSSLRFSKAISVISFSFEEERDFELDVEREEHELVLDVRTIPEELGCKSSFAVEVDLLNIGEEDEDVEIQVDGQKENFELDTGDNTRRRYTFPVEEVTKIMLVVSYSGIVEGEEIVMERDCLEDKKEIMDYLRFF